MGDDNVKATEDEVNTELCRCNTEACVIYPEPPEVLSFESHNLSDVPPSLTQHAPELSRTLTSLCISRNGLRTIPDTLYLLTSLTSLNLARNKLVTVPPGISALTALSKLVLMSNSLRLSTLPWEEIATLPDVTLVDLRYNEKLEKEVAARRLSDALGSRVRLARLEQQNAEGSSQPGQAPEKKKRKTESACDRDSTLLRCQLAPWSTPHLRRRLAELFGEVTDPEVVQRDEVMARLLVRYAEKMPDPSAPPRPERHVMGGPLAPELCDELTAVLRGLQWPTTTRERPKVQAEHYFTVNKPDTRFTVSTGNKALANERKLQKYAVLWELCNRAIASVDPEFAANHFTSLAVTHNFRDSPHIDTENLGPFYGMALGDFHLSGGGKLAVEADPCTVALVDTYRRMGHVDGRYPHWVTPYAGERFSLIFYQTVGPVVPHGPAIFVPFEDERVVAAAKGNEGGEGASAPVQQQQQQQQVRSDNKGSGGGTSCGDDGGDGGFGEEQEDC